MPPKGYRKRRHKWSKQACEEAGHKWVREHDGEVPAATDFNLSDLLTAAREHSNKASRWLGRARYFEINELPWTATILKLYGSWNNYILALGLTPRPANGTQSVSIPLGSIEDLSRLIDNARHADEDERQEILLRVAEQALGLAGA